jgi:hypothetical protein
MQGGERRQSQLKSLMQPPQLQNEQASAPEVATSWKQDHPPSSEVMPRRMLSKTDARSMKWQQHLPERQPSRQRPAVA